MIRLCTIITAIFAGLLATLFWMNLATDIQFSAAAILSVQSAALFLKAAYIKENEY